MKLIITGATGFVATEVLRQALLSPSITSIVAIARSSVSAPVGTSAANLSKLKSVIVKDYGTYLEDVRQEMDGADACIWTVAITPSKARALPTETVRKVCQEWTAAGLAAILESNPNQTKPFRFMYMSGAAASDPAHKHSKDTKMWMPKSMLEYSHMRGETATQITNLAVEHKAQVEVCIVKPGFITGRGGILRGIFGAALSWSGAVDTITLEEVSAAMLHQVVRGFEETGGVLTNQELMEIGREVLRTKSRC